MSDCALRSRATHPPCPGSGRSAASGPEQPARSCSCPPPDPTPRHWPPAPQPTAAGSAPTSPPPPSPQQAETDHRSPAEAPYPPSRHRPSALGCFAPTLAAQSRSRLAPPGPPRDRPLLPSLGPPASRRLAESRRTAPTDHPDSRHARDRRDDARATPPTTTGRPAASPPPASAATRAPERPRHSPPTTPRFQGGMPATPQFALDAPHSETSSADPPSQAATSHPPTTATTSRSPRPPRPAGRTRADARTRRTRPPTPPPAHSHAAPTPQRRHPYLRRSEERHGHPQTHRAAFRSGRSPGTTFTTAPTHLRHRDRAGKHQLTAAMGPYRCCRCPAGGAHSPPSPREGVFCCSGVACRIRRSGCAARPRIRPGRT